MGLLDDKVAVVTGAGRGIGREIALCLAAEGAAVVVNDVGSGLDGAGTAEDPAAETCAVIEKAGGRASANYESVSDFEAAGRIVAQAVDTYGRIDILVNNAGIVRPRIIYNMNESDWDDVIAVHMRGAFTMTRAAASIFREHKCGVIVNTASESGLGHLGQSSYSAAKEGIVGFTRTIARDLGRFNVRCNAIRPRAATRLFNEEALAAIQRTQTMLGGSGAPPIDSGLLDNKPEHVAALVVWLCTDAAVNVNGRTFLVGGDVVGIYPEPRPERTLIRDGGWDLESLDSAAPSHLVAGLINEFAPK